MAPTFPRTLGTWGPLSFTAGGAGGLGDRSSQDLFTYEVPGWAFVELGQISQEPRQAGPRTGWGWDPWCWAAVRFPGPHSEGIELW